MANLSQSMHFRFLCPQFVCKKNGWPSPSTFWSAARIERSEHFRFVAPGRDRQTLSGKATTSWPSLLGLWLRFTPLSDTPLMNRTCFSTRPFYQLKRHTVLYIFFDLFFNTSAFHFYISVQPLTVGPGKKGLAQPFFNGNSSCAQLSPRKQLSPPRPLWWFLWRCIQLNLPAIWVSVYAFWNPVKPGAWNYYIKKKTMVDFFFNNNLKIWNTSEWHGCMDTLWDHQFWKNQPANHPVFCTSHQILVRLITPGKLERQQAQKLEMTPFTNLDDFSMLRPVGCVPNLYFSNILKPYKKLFTQHVWDRLSLPARRNTVMDQRVQIQLLPERNEKIVIESTESTAWTMYINVLYQEKLRNTAKNRAMDGNGTDIQKLMCWYVLLCFAESVHIRNPEMTRRRHGACHPLTSRLSHRTTSVVGHQLEWGLRMGAELETTI